MSKCPKIFTHKFHSAVPADKAVRKQTWLSALKALIYCSPINYICTTLLKIMGLYKCH